MPESIFTSNRLHWRKALPLAAAIWIFRVALPLGALAAEGSPPSANAGGQTPAKGEEEDYSETPFTEYGEFNEEEDESAETKYFQYGRFFGLSVGTGFQGVTGNRGLLYQGGFPMIQLKFHYWFDFHLALDLGFTTVTQNFDTTVNSQGHVDVNMTRIGVDLKYYFDTKNIAAPISFANPYVILGMGSISKTEVTLAQASTTADSSFALSAGAGLEFVVSPRKTYFELEALAHMPNFQDSYTTIYSTQGIADLTGTFYTITGNILFTW